MKLYEHQEQTIDFGKRTPKMLNTSSPGTGKTLSTLFTWRQRDDGKLFVTCPKTIMDAAWGRDIHDHLHDVSYAVLDRDAMKKKPDYIKGMLRDHDIVISNIEGLPLFLDYKKVIENEFSTFVLDEFTSIKNRGAQRSKNAATFAEWFEYRTLLSGTPTPNSILDIWHPMMLIDEGKRLGYNYYSFRSAVCQPVAKRAGSREFTTWVDLPEATDIVGDIIKDVNIRFKLEDVVDMPERLFNTLTIPMNARLRKAYEEMEATAMLELDSGDITAVNAAVLGNKLLQIASGSVYSGTGAWHMIHDEKYELITELVDEREQSLVFYQWEHQAQALAQKLATAKLPFEVINGSVGQGRRNEIVNEFQDGRYRTLIIQPAAAAHGLTLTKSTASIWCSPTYNLEHFIQANHRDYRIGQNKTTEVIMIQYEDTIEPYVYHKLQGKQDALNNLLEILKQRRS